MPPRKKDTTTNYLIGGILSLIVVILAVEQLFMPVISIKDLPKNGDTCKGEPIVVSYEYGGGMMDPHECAPQCEDEIQRYIMYTNNIATQCQILPGCADWGEDNNVTCVPEGN